MTHLVDTTILDAVADHPRMFTDQLPIIVLDVDGAGTAPGSRPFGCMVCKEHFPMGPTTWQTVQDLRAGRRMHVVVCHGCFTHLNAPREGAHLATSTNQAREWLGLEGPS